MMQDKQNQTEMATWMDGFTTLMTVNTGHDLE